MSLPEKFQQLAEQGYGFAVFPDARIYESPGKSSKQHLLFGDYITPPRNEDGSYKKWTSSLLEKAGNEWWINVHSRQAEGWVKLDDIQMNRILEVNFVDIGQGDGCHLVTPSDEHFIIDAGAGDNMYRFLRWRFNLKNPGRELPMFYGLISHPDEDHWKGFELLLSEPPATPRQIKFEKLYHNGILQRADSKLGATRKVDGENYLVDFMESQDDFKKVLNAPGKKSTYEQFLIGALQHFPDLQIEAVWRDMGDQKFIRIKDKALSLEVLGPVPELIDGKRMLRWFDAEVKDIGKTKNGHSVVIMAKIGRMKIMLGGDLNSKASDYLMEKYSGNDIRGLKARIAEANENAGELKDQLYEIIKSCRNEFQAEVVKSCHHGSDDITHEFLQSINPIVTVISSGDEESYCHPRPETLGAIGKFSRGDRPLIFCTELARSSPEYVKLESKTHKTDETKQRIVSTYGMITLRTDGFNAVVAQKLEKPRSSFGKITKWHIEKLMWNDKRKEFVTNKG